MLLLPASFRCYIPKEGGAAGGPRTRLIRGSLFWRRADGENESAAIAKKAIAHGIETPNKAFIQKRFTCIYVVHLNELSLAPLRLPFLTHSTVTPPTKRNRRHHRWLPSTLEKRVNEVLSFPPCQPAAGRMQRSPSPEKKPPLFYSPLLGLPLLFRHLPPLSVPRIPTLSRSILLFLPVATHESR